MRPEIEALMQAYAAERDKEIALVRDILAALAAGISSRSHLLKDIGTAVMNNAEPISSPKEATLPSSPKETDITSTIHWLRNHRGH